MELLNKIVKDCLAQHEGGEKFFDYLDENIRVNMNILDLLSVKFLLGNDFDKIVVSGKFGRMFANYYMNDLYTDDAKIIMVNGGLRKDEPIDDLSHLNIKGKKFIFVDDSFYSGKTRNVIKAEIERLGGKLIQTYVVYDGSKEKDKTVRSLYRYYDNFKEELNAEG